VENKNINHAKLKLISKDKKLICLFTLIFVLISIFPGPASAASSRSYHISEYIINITINTDGSAHVEEHITYNFSGKFNGVTFDIDLSGTKGISNSEVFIIKQGQQIPVEKNNSEKPGTYLYTSEDEMIHFKVFEPSEDEEKTFIYKYTLHDAVTKYKDIAEFNRKMIGTGWQVHIENVLIKATLPDGAEKDDIRVFGHGPLTGTSQIIDHKTVEFTVPLLPPETFVETRILFPTSLVPNSENIVDKTALPEILEHESKLAEKANIEREKAREQLRTQEERERKLRTAGKVSFYALLLFWFFTIILLYIKYDKEYKSKFTGKYYRELPGEYTPAEMSVLMNMGYVQPRDIMATLMDLVRKKYLILEEVTFHRKTLFGDKQIKDYKISINPKSSPENLKSHESFLIQWFINEIGNGTSVLLNDITNYSKDQKQALDFNDDYDLWCEKVQNEAKKNNFFDSSTTKGIIIGVLIAFVYIIAGVLMPTIFYFPVGFILTVLGIILLIFSARIKRRSPYGNEQYIMWKAFRRFLKDFSRLEHAEIPSIILWEHYLVYAISLGVAKEVIKQLPLVFRDEDLTNPQLTYLYSMSYGHFNTFERTFNNAINTIQASVTSAASIASSQDSSKTGSGGGFSGGSSGGGGGGGGGGAF